MTTEPLVWDVLDSGAWLANPGAESARHRAALTAQKPTDVQMAYFHGTTHMVPLGIEINDWATVTTLCGSPHVGCLSATEEIDSDVCRMCTEFYNLGAREPGDHDRLADRWRMQRRHERERMEMEAKHSSEIQRFESEEVLADMRRRAAAAPDPSPHIEGESWAEHYGEDPEAGFRESYNRGLEEERLGRPLFPNER